MYIQMKEGQLVQGSIGGERDAPEASRTEHEKPYPASEYPRRRGATIFPACFAYSLHNLLLLLTH